MNLKNLMNGSWKEKNTKMDDEKMYVPYIVYEGEMARQERQIKRLIMMLTIMLVLLFASNMAWLYVWNQYEYVDETTETTIKATQDGEGVNIVGGEDITYGSESSNNEENETPVKNQKEEKR